MPDDAGIERRAYVAGWQWGVVCGIVCGAMTTGLATLLVNVALAAWRCPTC